MKSMMHATSDSRAFAAHRWRSWERSARFVAVWAAFIALTAFYLIPIIAIQATPMSLQRLCGC